MIGLRLMRAALHVPGLTSTERLVLAEYAEFTSRERGMRVWRSRADLVAKTGANAQTIQRAVSRLRDLGYLSVVGKARKGLSLRVELHPERWPEPPRPQTGSPSGRAAEEAPAATLWADAEGWGGTTFPEATAAASTARDAPPEQRGPPPWATGGPRETG